MAKIFRILLILIGGLVGILIIGAIALKLFFDPNDFKENISNQVRNSTGRELAIEGDISISVFPWLAVEIGETSLGNAEGFGDEPFLRFESASLSVEFMPLVLSREISIGTVSLDGLAANLVVASNGTTNWDDLSSNGEDVPEETTSGDGGDQALDIADVRLTNANLSYRDDVSGSSYSLTDLAVGTGQISTDEPFDLDASFQFAAAPGELGGELSIRGSITLAKSLQQISIDGFNVSGQLSGIVSEPTSFNLDSRAISLDAAAQTMSLGETDLAILGMTMSADVEPFSYAGIPAITATLRVADFSLKELMQTLDIEPPLTADPSAMGKISFSGKAQTGADALTLSEMTLVLDDTTMTGELAVPISDGGSLTFDLRADSINLDNYMAPASDAPVAEDEAEAADIEIPVDLIRALDASGSVRLDEAFLGPMTFTNMQLGIVSSDDVLRLHPITAEFFDGAYNGDVRIDASGVTPSISANENISGVNLSAMALALFEAEDISGTIEANLKLGGSGATVSAIQRDLDGTMSFDLADGALEGTDVWHQLRSARALYKREDAPEATLPARTEFSAIKATGVVTDGVFANDDLLIEMPFLRITGNGVADLVSTEIDYSVQARVLDNPELVNDISEDEMSDFTEALIPIRIRGTLGAPTFRPDIEAMFRQEVERAIDEKADELKKDLFDSLLGGDEPADPDAPDGEETDAEPKEEEKIEDQLKNSLRDLFKN